jgi:transketolase
MMIQQDVANAIRFLSIDAVQKANSGHPGAPMGMADLATVLWGKYLTVDPSDPTWPDRDRFVLSNGHASMLLYAVLHLSGFPVSMTDIENFRQLKSPTAGHPEIEQHLGIETTTGPLGQGFATGVGMALAEEHLRDRFGADLVDHRTYAFVSDGDLMEGVASESASLAGHLGLGKLVYLYDDNEISLVGPTSWTFSEDVPARFGSYGWHTITVDGHDHQAIDEAIATAIADPRPSLLSCKTHIGFGSPNKQDTAGAHGSPLGDEEIALVREGLGWDHGPFVVPDTVYAWFSDAMSRGRDARAAWQGRLEADAERAADWEAYQRPAKAAASPPVHEAGSKVASRSLSGQVINELAAVRPDLLGGSADLASSNNTLIKTSTDFSTGDRSGRNIRFGVREHAMGAIVNGIAVHGGLRPFGATFLQFADYMRGAVRLGALMGAPSIWVWTHDSVFLGEDGPTHQPVEHLASLRAIPNLWVMRPSDPAETAAAWNMALNRTDGPTAIVLTRQGLEVPAESADVGVVASGGYVVSDGSDVTLVATGSEVSLARAAAGLLEGRGVVARVVSMPCVEVFMEQDDAYRRETLGTAPIVTLEAGVTYGWASVVGGDALHIGIDHFGDSAPAADLAVEYGFTPEAVAERVAAWLG